MWFVLLGMLLVVLKLAEFGPPASWSWWWVISPFGLATLWWAFSDKIGLTKRREMKKMEEKKAARRKASMVSLGMDERGRRHSGDK